MQFTFNPVYISWQVAPQWWLFYNPHQLTLNYWLNWRYCLLCLNTAVLCIDSIFSDNNLLTKLTHWNCASLLETPACCGWKQGRREQWEAKRRGCTAENQKSILTDATFSPTTPFCSCAETFLNCGNWKCAKLQLPFIHVIWMRLYSINIYIL